jgi:hypothetical protein
VRSALVGAHELHPFRHRSLLIDQRSRQKLNSHMMDNLKMNCLSSRVMSWRLSIRVMGIGGKLKRLV